MMLREVRKRHDGGLSRCDFKSKIDVVNLAQSGRTSFDIVLRDSLRSFQIGLTNYYEVTLPARIVELLALRESLRWL